MNQRRLISAIGVILSIVMVLWGEARGQNPIMPSKPQSGFRNPTELRSYLRRLGKYYTSTGQPRFGKRAGDLADEGMPYQPSNNRYPAITDLPAWKQLVERLALQEREILGGE